ncbi:MAG: glutathione S-transferase family protein [Rhizobiaceae bacterium]|nr:glutathione S-transferase family protein [Rhizobiaceae bacterium]
MAIVLYELVGADEKRPFSPHVWKIAMALAHKGLDWKAAPTRFLDIKNVEDGSFRTLPILRDGEKVISDSFSIALYLEEAYPDRPSLFRGKGGEAMSRFIERWSQTQLHSFMGSAALMDLYDMQDEANRIYFRESREKRYGMPLEQVDRERDSHLETFRKRLEPLRDMLKYQPFIGGQTPLYADYIVFGAFQWVRISSTYRFIAEGDPISEWVERCLDLHNGFARSYAAAA